MEIVHSSVISLIQLSLSGERLSLHTGRTCLPQGLPYFPVTSRLKAFSPYLSYSNKCLTHLGFIIFSWSVRAGSWVQFSRWSSPLLTHPGFPGGHGGRRFLANLMRGVRSFQALL